MRLSIRRFVNDRRAWFAGALLIVSGAFFLLPRASPAREGTRWEGALDLPPTQAAGAWLQFAHDSAHTSNARGANPLQGKIEWSFAAHAPIIASPVAGAGVVHVSSTDGYLYALDALSARELWRYPIGPKLVNSTPARAGNLLLVAGDYTWLYALDARSGQRVWGYNTFDNILAPPAADALAQLAFVTNGASLFALELRDGTPRWELQLADQTRNAWPSVGAPAVARGGVYWAPGIGSRLLALDEASGNVRWSFDAEDRLASTPVIGDGVIFLATWTGEIVALDEATGALRWTQTLGNRAPGEGTESTPAYDGTRLYLGSYQGIFYALNALTGAVLWQFNAGRPILSAPAVSEGVVYFSGEDGNLYSLDTATGTLRWKIYLGEMRSSPALADGGIYVGSMSGVLVRVH